jgi:hypothetical protein
MAPTSGSIEVERGRGFPGLEFIGAIRRLTAAASQHCDAAVMVGVGEWC